MSIHKIMQPRIDPEFIRKRRQLYREEDWKGYERLMRQQLGLSIRVAEQGYQALGKILGISVSQVRQSVQTYCFDLEKRDIFEKFMSQDVADAEQGRQPKELSKI